MRRPFSSVAFLLALSSISSLSSAQGPVNPPPSLMNFQGRLAKPDGTPVADATNVSLTLSLWDTVTGGTKRWEQTFTNVSVRNGTFAVLLNLSSGFVGGNTLDTTLNNNTYLQVQVGSNSPLTPRQQLVSTAYALKAGSVPDGSITFDKLALSARNLTGAAGGDLQGSFPTPQIKTDGSLLTKVSGTLLTVPSTTFTTSVDQSQLAPPTAQVNSSAWQAFTPASSGTLVELDVYCGTTGASVPATLNLYLGEGTGTTPILTVPITVNSALGLQSFVISLPVTQNMAGDQKYTWSIGSNNNLLFGYTGGNPYAGGISSLGNTFDFGFRTIKQVSGGPTSQINATTNLYFVGGNSVLGDAVNAPMITRQFNPFTGGTYTGIGRYGLFKETDTLFLGVPGTDYSGTSNIVLGGWLTNGTRQDWLTVQEGGATSVVGNLSAPTATIPTLNGTVGIGNAATAVPLTFADVLGDKISLYGQAGNAQYGFGVQGNLLQIHSDVAASDIVFGYGKSSAFTERMRIKGTGNVGIGTTSPTSLLDVNGTLRLRSLATQGGNVLTVDTSGNVGQNNVAAALGNAGGDLTGSYPNPTITTGAVTTAKIAANAVTSAKLASDSGSLSKVTAGVMTGNAGSITINETEGIAIRFSGDGEIGVDTGIGHPADGMLSFISNASEVGRFAGANFGIGTSTPSARLHVAGNARFDGNVETRNASHTVTNGSGQIRSLVSYNSGVDTGYLQILNGNNVTVTGFGGDISGGNVYVNDGSGNNKVSVGPSYADFTGRASVNGAYGNVTVTAFCISGQDYAFGTSNRMIASGYSTTSDRRLKKNIVTLSSALDSVLKLRGVFFDWDPDMAKGRTVDPNRQVGFIAQEVEAVIPQLVHNGLEGYKSVEYANLTPYLVEAIKEQQVQIETLKAEVSTLKQQTSRIALLEKQMAQLLASQKQK